MSTAVGALMAGLIDYAGLFPPAGLAMGPAVAAYAAHRRSGEGWILGRFVVPIARLAEFEAAYAALEPAARGAEPWALSGLIGADVAGDARAAGAFNLRCRGRAAIRSLELRVDGVAQIQAARIAVPATFELFYEVPVQGDLRWLLAAIRAMGGRAKMRTGGVTAAEVPGPESVLRFLEGCAAIRLPFKATAGLHHAVRGERALTYEESAPRATLFGYLNVLLAAAAVWERRPRAEARAVLEAQGPDGLALEADAVRFAGSRLDAASLARARREFALSIGSCSFDEPVGEIRSLGASFDAAA